MRAAIWGRGGSHICCVYSGNQAKLGIPRTVESDQPLHRGEMEDGSEERVIEETEECMKKGS